MHHIDVVKGRAHWNVKFVEEGTQLKGYYATRGEAVEAAKSHVVTMAESLLGQGALVVFKVRRVDEKLTQVSW